MAEAVSNHDDVLMNVLVENKTLVGFLFSVFGFLSRRTDFYFIRDESDADSFGFPPGVAEELVVRVLRKCNPSNSSYNESISVPDNCHELIGDGDSACIPPPVALEVEVESTEDLDSDYIEACETIEGTDTDDFERIASESKPKSSDEGTLQNSCTTSNITLESLSISDDCPKNISENQHVPLNKNPPKNGKCENKSLESPEHTSISSLEPPKQENERIPSNTSKHQTHSESYNGAKRDKYSWSQTIRELDVTIKLPAVVKSSKQLNVVISSDSMNIKFLSSEKQWIILINDKLSNKTKHAETIWTMSEGKIRIHLEKQSEIWWNSLLKCEEKIDTSKIDCSRPLDELPESHIAKVRELQWNQLQKLEGKPTSDELRQQEILKKAWNMPGSPFVNTPYDPNILH